MAIDSQNGKWHIHVLFNLTYQIKYWFNKQPDNLVLHTPDISWKEGVGCGCIQNFDLAISMLTISDNFWHCHQIYIQLLNFSTFKLLNKT